MTQRHKLFWTRVIETIRRLQAPGRKSWKPRGSHGAPDQRLFPGALMKRVCQPDLRQMDTDTFRLLF
jgi:hypothetical protein